MINTAWLAILVLGIWAFFIILAYVTERKALKGTNWATHPIIYSLSLGIYCSSWTYFGGVGMAAQSGLLFLAIFIGPTLGTLLFLPSLRRLVRIKNRLRITSVADFLSGRHGNTESLGALTTIITLTGITPLIALQLKSITSTTAVILSHESPNPQALEGAGWVIVALLILSSILLGIHKLDPTERHPGLTVMNAAESILKVSSLLIAGVFIVYFMSNGLGDVLDRAPRVMADPDALFGRSSPSAMFNWISYLLLSGFAVVFLPRQFHAMVVENYDERHILPASWQFPLFLLLVNVFVFPIAVSGLAMGLPSSNADTFLLDLPLHANNHTIAILVYIGGFFAAVGMIMMESLANATMITNYLLLPIIVRVPALSFLKGHLLKCRWLATALVIVLGYLYAITVGNTYALVAMGMISFTAILQVAPATIGGLFWKGATRFGALCGLGVGFLLWSYTLFLPAFIKSGIIQSSLLDSGPFGLGLLNPESLFGLTGLDPIPHAVFWTLLANSTAYVVGSLFSKPTETEIKTSLVYEIPNERLLRATSSSLPYIDQPSKQKKIEMLLQQYFSASQARELARQCFHNAGATTPKLSVTQLASVQEEVERVLTGTLGPAATHSALKNAEIITADEADALSTIYGEMLANLKLSPSDIKRKINFHLEREKLLAAQTEELKKTVAERDLENLEKTNELRLANEQLLHSLAELKETQARLLENSKFTALGEMSAGLAHEINTPLATIQLLATQTQEVITEGPLDIPLVTQMLKTIEETSVRIAAIVKGLRTFSRQAESDPFHKERISKIIKDTLSFCKDRFKAEGIGLFQDYEDEEVDTIEISCRPTQISQVVLNLLNNARDAIATRPEKWIRIGVEQTTEALSIFITDSGKGLPEELRNKIFQPFFTTKAVGEGTGLGLSVSKGIVEAHGGTLSVDAACPNTRFVIRLPKVRSPM